MLHYYIIKILTWLLKVDMTGKNMEGGNSHSLIKRWSPSSVDWLKWNNGGSIIAGRHSTTTDIMHRDNNGRLLYSKGKSTCPVLLTETLALAMKL